MTLQEKLDQLTLLSDGQINDAEAAKPVGGVFSLTDPKLIDDSALNYVGLDDTDPNAKDDSVVSTLVVPVNRPIELILKSKGIWDEMIDKARA